LKPSSESASGGWLPLLLIVLVTILLFADVLIGSRTLYFRDIYNNHLPLKTLQADQILAGETPFWNPGLSGGQPLLANLNLFTFHPSTLLFLLLDPVSAVNWTVFLQLLLAGISAFLLARRLGWGDPGALFTALAFALSGYMLSLGNLLNMLNSAAWLPLTAWLFLGWRRTGSPLSGAGAVLSLAIQLLGGDPGMVLATLLLMALLVFREGEGAIVVRPRWRELLALAGTVLAAAGLCGLQYLPFRELLQQSVRGWGFTYRGATFWSTHPLRLAEMHLPAFFGDVNSTVGGALWGSHLFDDGFPLILSIYAGQAVLLFAGMALLTLRRDRDLLLFGLMFLTGLVLALGGHTPLYRLVHALPVAGGMRFPSRFLILVVLALALLSGKVFGRLAAGHADSGERRRVSRFSLAAMVWAVAGALLLTVALLRDSLDAGSLGRGLLAQFFLLGAALLAWACSSGRLKQTVFVAAVLALLAADLFCFGYGVNFRTDRTFFSSTPPAAEAIRSHAGHDGLVRVFRQDKPKEFRLDPPAKEKEWVCLWDRSLLSPPSGLLLGIGYDLGVSTDLLSPRSTAQAARRMYAGGAAERRLMWDLSSIDYVLAFEDPGLPGLLPVHRTSDFSSISMVSLQNQTALPRARLVPEPLFAGDDDELDAVFAEGFDPGRQVVLAGTGDPSPPGLDGEAGHCRIVHDSPSRVVVAVEPNRPRFTLTGGGGRGARPAGLAGAGRQLVPRLGGRGGRRPASHPPGQRPAPRGAGGAGRSGGGLPLLPRLLARRAPAFPCHGSGAGRILRPDGFPQEGRGGALTWNPTARRTGGGSTAWPEICSTWGWSFPRPSPWATAWDTCSTAGWARRHGWWWPSALPERRRPSSIYSVWCPDWRTETWPPFLTVHLLRGRNCPCLLRYPRKSHLDVFQYVFAGTFSCALYPRAFPPSRDEGL